jgi:alpha-beta hydrolase superfamily lysophospholipase
VAAVVLLFGLIALLIGVLTYLSVALYFAELFTRSKRSRVQGTPEDLGIRFQNVQFLTADRMTLTGWFQESPGARATIIVIHDREGNRADSLQGLLHLQADYVRQGFNVFSFDLRGRGESAGQRDHLGATEQVDVQAAIAYVRRRTSRLPIVLHGFGFGAALALQTAPGALDIAGVIADSPIASMRDLLRYRHQRIPHTMFRLTCFLSRRIFGGDTKALTPIDVIGRLDAPVLFIHAEADNVVPESHTLNLCAASLNPRHETWMLHDFRGHCRYYVEHPKEYLSRCQQFVEQIVPARFLAPVEVQLNTRTIQAG